ncbi:MAG: Ig domain-containing protein, partial [Clostridia bacterium]|nr:Ig domain-containing protein [Clostridia bacterium]
TSQKATVRFENLNASRFKLRAAQHSEISDLLSFEVSYDGVTFESVGVLVKTVDTYKNVNGWPTRQCDYVSSEFERPIKAVRITRDICYEMWYSNFAELLYEEAPREYNDSVASKEGVASNSAKWQPSELFREQQGYSLDTSEATDIEYRIGKSLCFKVRVAHKADETPLSFSVSCDGTTFTPVNLKMRELGRYETADGITVVEAEYISSDFNEPISTLKISKSADSGISPAFVDVQFINIDTDKNMLGLVLEQAKAVTKKDYDDKLWSDFNTAIQTAQTVYDDFKSIQTSIDLQVKKLLAAAAALYNEKTDVISGFNLNNQGDSTFYLYTSDYKKFNKLPYSGVPTGGGMIWWSLNSPVEWGKAVLVSAVDGNALFFCDNESAHPAVSVCADKTGYVRAEYDKDKLDIFVTDSLNNTVNIIDNPSLFYVEKGNHIIFAWKAGMRSAEALGIGNPSLYYVNKVDLEKIILDKTDVSMTFGDVTDLSYVLSPLDANNLTNAVWSSENEQVAVVSDNGTVVAVGGGETVIRVQIGNISAECTVKVNSPLNGISLKKSTVISLGGSEQLEVAYEPWHTTDPKNVVWQSSDESIVSVNNGVIEGKAVGNAVITAMVGDKTATCNVLVVIPLLSVKLNKENLLLNAGKTEKLSAVKYPSNTTVDADIVWQSTDTGVATVDQNGVVTAVSGGEATIIATIDGKSAVCTVKVNSKLQKIELNKLRSMLVKGYQDVLNVNCYPFSATDISDVVWTTSNNKVASVENGKVTANSRGVAVITANVAGKTAECVVAVVEDKEDIISFENTGNISNINVTSPQTGDDIYTVFYVFCILFAAVLAIGGILNSKNKERDGK